MKQGFTPISIKEYVRLHLKHNREQDPGQLTAALEDALSAYKHGVKCACGNPIWVIGSAISGYACFTCITGEAYPDDDYEIDEACDSYAVPEEDQLKLRMDQVSRIIREHPQDYVDRLEEIGFQWFDDEWDLEEEEELAARPRTPSQEALVRYFEGDSPPTQDLLDALQDEKYAEEPNYPLIRRYFKQINSNLKRLILWGLDRYPTDSGLLDDLSFFQEFDNVLSELIDRYKRACLLEEDPGRFDGLARDFYLNTVEFGFDAYYELTGMFKPNTMKREIVDLQVAELRESTSGEPKDIPF